MSVCRRSFAVLACAAVGVALWLPAAGYAAPPITVTSKTPADGPIKYTVKVMSKTFGNVQETRTIRSGQTDDFNWKTVPPGGAVQVGSHCPNYSALTLDANGAVMRSLNIRLAPIVSPQGTATVQMSVQASAPEGTVKGAGKCPALKVMSQVLRFDMPTNGKAKTVSLKDGTKVKITARR